MASFPTIYVHYPWTSGTLEHTPVVGDFDDTMAHDPTIRSLSDGGYVQSRARFTRITRKWTVRYSGLSKTNKDTIHTFENARLGGSENFTFSRPDYSTAVNVRFLGPVRYVPWANTNFLQWDVEFILEQV